MTRFFLGCLSLILVAAAPAYADKNDITIEQFREAGAGSYIDASYAYAVFPSIGKGGVIIGGAQGEGTVFQGGQAIGEVKMNQLTVGLQFGGQTYSQIIFFEDARALREFTSGNFKFGAQATAVALNTGASAEASTGGGTRTSINAGNDNGVEVDSRGFVSGMAVFTIAQGGFMLEASLGGQRYRYNPF